MKQMLTILFVAATGCVAADSSDDAALTWTDSDATLTQHGTSTVFAHADAPGAWKIVLPQEAASRPILEQVLIEQERAEADGVALPWLAAPPTANLCTTRSTWVFGGSCVRCLNMLHGYGTLDSDSCDMGTVYSTCSATFC